MRYAIMLLVTGLLATAALAQQGQGPRGQMLDPQAQLERLTEQLGLSTEQADAIAPILVDQDAKRRELMTAAREQGDRQGMRERMMSLREDTNEKLAEHLSAQQMGKLQALREEQRERFRQQRGSRPQDPR